MCDDKIFADIKNKAIFDKTVQLLILMRNSNQSKLTHLKYIKLLLR